MSSPKLTIRPERLEDANGIAHVTALAFGPGMKARAAHALREGVDHLQSVSFVAVEDDEIVGSVRQTPIYVGETRVLMLGPIGVLPARKDQGIGKKLMWAAIDAARAAAEKPPQEGQMKSIILVGDFGYYSQFGFVHVKPGSVTMPRPVDPARILICELIEGAANGIAGAARSIR